MGRLGGTTQVLRDKLLREQAKAAEQERRLPYAEKLRLLDQLILDHQDCKHFPSDETYRELYLRTRPGRGGSPFAEDSDSWTASIAEVIPKVEDAP